MQKLTNIVLLLALSSFALAANAYSPSSEGHHTISPMLGFMGPGHATLTDNINGTDDSAQMNVSGFYGIGADYEYGLKNDLSVGGMFRYYSSNDTIGRTDETDTAMLLGGIAHARFLNTDKWAAYVGSGLTLVKVSVKNTPPNGGPRTFSPPMTLGVPFALGLGYKLNDDMTLGIEHLQVLALGDKVNGWPVSDFMFRFSFML